MTDSTIHGARRKFQINPEPLKIVPDAQRKQFAKPGDLRDVGRCEARVDGGVNRCLRDGTTDVDGRWLCTQHARVIKPQGPDAA